MQDESEDVLITVNEAAQLRGVTAEAIRSLIKRGKLRYVEKYEKRLLYRSEVLAFKKEKPGRKTDGKSQA